MSGINKNTPASRFTDPRRSVPRDKVKTSVGLRGGDCNDCTFRNNNGQKKDLMESNCTLKTSIIDINYSQL